MSEAGRARVERDGHVLRLVLDHPPRRNALDHAAMRKLTQAVSAAAEDDVRVIVLTGNGDHFCAGADISQGDRGAPDTRSRTGAVHRGMADAPHRLLRALWDVEVPVVAGVRGAAAGFGCMLALSADHVIAGTSARLSTPYARRGFSADSGSTWLLPRLVGLTRAKQMLLLGREVAAAEAVAWGLVTETVADEQLDEAVVETAAGYATGATVALGLTRQLLHGGLDVGLAEALRAEEMAVELSVRSPDFREGIGAFRDRREPHFSGR